MGPRWSCCRGAPAEGPGGPSVDLRRETLREQRERGVIRAEGTESNQRHQWTTLVTPVFALFLCVSLPSLFLVGSRIKACLCPLCSAATSDLSRTLMTNAFQRQEPQMIKQQQQQQRQQQQQQQQQQQRQENDDS
ncbi:hypothetical protein Emed_002897 [Eimeria media]